MGPTTDWSMKVVDREEVEGFVSMEPAQPNLSKNKKKKNNS